MKSFQDFCDLKEMNVTAFGRQATGGQSLSNTGGDSLAKIMKALEIIMAVNPSAFGTIVNRMNSVLNAATQDDPNLSSMLKAQGIDLKDTAGRSQAKRAARKVYKGLGDVTAHDAGGRNLDIVTPAAADTNSGMLP